MHGDESDERVRDARHSSILKEVEVWVKSIFISNCATKPYFLTNILWHRTLFSATYSPVQNLSSDDFIKPFNDPVKLFC